MQQQRSLGIKVISLQSCVGISIEGKLKTSVVYSPSVYKNNHIIRSDDGDSSLEIISCPFVDTGPQMDGQITKFDKVQRKDTSPIDVLKIILKNLITSLSQDTKGTEQYSIVYTIPASFDDNQKQIVQEAASFFTNLNFQIIDDHRAFAIYLANMKELDLGQTILIFDLSDGKIEVSLYITQDGGVEIKFKQVGQSIDDKLVKNKDTKEELDQLWEEYGLPQIKKVLADGNKINNVLLIAAYPQSDVNYLKELFMNILDKQNIVGLNQDWSEDKGVVYVSALLAQRLTITKNDQIIQLTITNNDQIIQFLISLKIDEIYERIKKLNQQDQVILLNQLKIKQKPKFMDYCKMTNHFKDNEYKQKLQLLNMLAKKLKIDECNKQLKNCFDKDNNRGYTLYLNLVDTIQGLKNPDPDDSNQAQLLIQIRLLELPSDCKANFDELMIYLESSIEECVAESLCNIKKVNETFYNQMTPIISQISKNLEDIICGMSAPESIGPKAIEVLKILKTNTEQGTQILDLKPPQSHDQLYQQNLAEIFKQFDSKSVDMRDQFEIKNFMTIDSEFDAKIVEQKIASFYKSDYKLQTQSICILLFDYIKRRFNFSNLINILSRQGIQCYLTKSVLVNLLMKNSDTYLRTMLFIACSTFMPVPLISYDWETSKLLLWKELFYVFEKRKAIFSFKISKNKMKGPRGCTTLTNALFNRDFEKHSSSLTNFGSIDLQFDYNFATPLFVPVADAHGFLDCSVLRKVYNLFDIFIIHIINREEDQILLKEEIIEIQSINKSALIIVLEHDPNFAGTPCLKEKVSDQHLVFRLKPYQKLLEQDKTNLKDEIFQLVIKVLPDEYNYLEDIDQRMKSMQEFTVLLKNFKIDDDYTNNAITLVKTYIQEIQTNSEDLHSEKFLPLNYIFAKRCKVFHSLQQDSDIDQTQRDSLTKTLKELGETLKAKGEAPILHILQKIIQCKNFLGLSSIIAKLLKAYIDSQLKPLLEIRTKLRSDSQVAGLDENRKTQVEVDKKLITKKIENKQFSNEYVIRELYLLGVNQKQNNQKYFNLYTELAELQISQGQPFEIIDGNNLQFVQDIFDQIYSNQDDSVLVVSVIGPQSSGKSLLLNFLFGTQFQSSAGRCTQGVYGTIIELKGSNTSTYKKILLLDTEGIQSTESRNDEFDNRIVFYIFCVSHLVLICNKGEMNNQMSEIIKLSADAISNLKEGIVKGMSVNIVMNMLAQINEQALEECITKLETAITGMKNGVGKSFQKLFNISKENIFMLPYAFDGQGHEKIKVNQPSIDFSLKLEPLRKKIIDKTINVDSKLQSNYTMKEWFTFANKFWIFTQSFKGINDYTTLDQKKDDFKLISKINSLIDILFDQKVKYHQDQIDDMLKEVMKPYRGFVVISIQTLSDNMKEKLTELHQQIIIKIQDQLREYCREEKISLVLRDKRSSFLLRRMKQYKTEWTVIANTKLAIFNYNRSKLIGNQQLENAVTELRQKTGSYSLDEAKEEFETAWKQVVANINKCLKTTESVKSEVQALIQGHYKSEIMENRYEQIDQEHKQLSSYQSEGSDSLIKFIKSQANEFFYFIGNEIRPNINNILSLQGEKKFLVTLKKDLYKLEYIYLDLNKLLMDRFNSEQLFDDIGNYLISGILFRKVDINHIKIKEIITQLQSESLYFNLQVNSEFIDKLQNLEKTLLSYMNQEGQQILDIDSIQSSFKKYRIHIVSNITIIFSYKNMLIPMSQQNLKYFHIKNYRYPDYITKNSTFVLDQDLVQIKRNITVTEACFSDIYVRRYFEFLENPQNQPLNDKSQESQKARVYFFDQLNTVNIVKAIETIVLQNYKSDAKIDSKSIKDWLEEIKSDVTQKLRTQFCQIDRIIVQQIIMQIKDLIRQIDDELEPFCQKISEYGVSSIHLISQTFINALAEQLELDKEQTPLQILEGSKQFHKNIFVAKLTNNDNATDKALAQKNVADLFEIIQQQSIKSAVDHFQDNILLIKDKFNNNKIIERVEQYAVGMAKHLQTQEEKFKVVELYKQDQIQNSEEESDLTYRNKQPIITSNPQIKKIQQPIIVSHKEITKDLEQKLGMSLNDVVDYYVQPKEFLKKKFQSQWDEETKTLLRESKIKYKKEVQGTQNSIIKYLEELRDLLIDRKIHQSQLFMKQSYLQNIVDGIKVASKIISQGQAPENYNYNTQNKKDKEDYQKATVIYFGMLINKTWKQDTSINLDQDNCLKCIPEINLPLPEDLKKSLPSDLISEVMLAHLQNQQISRLDNYLTHFIESMKNLEPYELKDVEIFGNNLQDFKNIFVGCFQYCPLCRRQCDIAHLEQESLEERIHSCCDGHQYQGFGGSRDFSTNEALTIGCNDLKDNVEVAHNNEVITYLNFKLKYEKWSFDVNKDQSFLSNLKNELIWNLIGPKICEYYTRNYKEVIFVKARQQQYTKIHYILLLDRSGSMANQRWDDLIIAVKAFLKTLEANPSLKQNSRVSIIGYDNKPQKICYKRIPSISLVDMIKFTGGGTEFNKPLLIALHFMEKSFDVFDRYVVCFMSDGCADYPSEAIKAIQSSIIFPKLDFRAIGYGDGKHIQKVMKPMTKELNGTMVIEVKPAALASAFIKIIPNPYQN